MGLEPTTFCLGNRPCPVRRRLRISTDGVISPIWSDGSRPWMPLIITGRLKNAAQMQRGVPVQRFVAPACRPSHARSRFLGADYEYLFARNADDATGRRRSHGRSVWREMRTQNAQSVGFAKSFQKPGSLS